MTDKIYKLLTSDLGEAPKVGDRVEVRLHPDPENDGIYVPSYYLHMADGGELFASGVWKSGDDDVWGHGSWGDPEEVTGIVAEVRVKPRSAEKAVPLNADSLAAYEGMDLSGSVWLSITPD